MAKIVFIGAGSTVFAKNLMGDVLGFPELAESTLTLFDIDQERLKTSEVVAHKVAEALDAKPTIEATTDRKRALDGADYAICMIQVGGYKPATVVDFEIPKKIRPASDNCRYAWNWRYYAWSTHHPRAAGHVPRYGRSLPRCHLPAVC